MIMGRSTKYVAPFHARKAAEDQFVDEVFMAFPVHDPASRESAQPLGSGTGCQRHSSPP
jgi:hypothetical protein